MKKLLNIELINIEENGTRGLESTGARGWGKKAGEILVKEYDISVR
jgi:hypothetical protein